MSRSPPPSPTPNSYPALEPVRRRPDAQTRTRFDGDVDFGRLRARDTEVGVQVVPDRTVHEVDPLEVQVLWLGHVERELEVQRQVICRQSSDVTQPA